MVCDLEWPRTAVLLTAHQAPWQQSFNCKLLAHQLAAEALAKLRCRVVRTGLDGARAADISHNRLAALPPGLCQLTSLASLKLSHNQLQDSGMPWQQLCSSLSSCLNTLQLGHNQLQQLPACLGQLTALTSLSIKNNRLQQVEPGALEGLVKLEVLQLQNNQLQQLPGGLGERPWFWVR